MPNCMICGTAIVDDSKNEKLRDTFEHLFPESIGGRKGVRGFIHRGCNSVAGSTWDAELATQLQPLCLMFDVARQKGATPDLGIVTSAGERLTLGPAGQLKLTNPQFEKSTNDAGQVAYSIKARSIKEARKMLRGLKRKHPDLDIEAELAKAIEEERYAEGLVYHDLRLVVENGGRSVVKSCVAMAFASGVDWTLCNHALRYIRNPEGEPCFGYYQERDWSAP